MSYGYDPLNRLSLVTDVSGVTSYSYDAVGNLAGYSYPNGISTSYTYDTLNRLTNMQSLCGTATAPACATPTTAISSYTYTLGAAGNRLSVAELSGRSVNYGYDDLYRLTSETVASDPHGNNGQVSYTFDNVGNRVQRASTVPGVVATGLLNYDANDRTATDPYDADGNLLSSGAGANVYDFENHLVQAGGVKLVYDGDGNRVKETVATVTTSYLVADQNLTGYAQVLDELQNGSVSRTYSYGLSLISQKPGASGSQLSFYGFDGHGSVRLLTDSTGAVTDTYDYDAFGILTSHTGATANNYLFAGEQFDTALGIYYNRARYYDQRQGRFWTMDCFEGDPQSPSSLHKYLYAGANPVDHIDRSGHDGDLGSLSAAVAAIATVVSQSWVAIQNVAYSIYFDLYRVPQIVDTVSRWLLYFQGSVEIASAATGTIERMASNLQNSTQILPAGGGPMGNAVEKIAGGNVVRNTPSYDYFDQQNQIAGQIQGTRNVSTSDALMRDILRGVNKLVTADNVVSTITTSGGRVQIVQSNLKVRFLVEAIPDQRVTWDFRAFMEQVEQMEQASKIVIKVVPTKILN